MATIASMALPPAASTVWPVSAARVWGAATAAVENILGGDKLVRMSRTPEIMADAAHLALVQDAKSFTGRFLIDDSFLYDVGGVRDFEKYRVDASMPLAPDFFVPADRTPPPGVTLARLSMMP